MRSVVALPAFIEPLITRGRSWWEDRAPRERALLLVLASLVLLWGGLAGKRWAESKLKELNK